MISSETFVRPPYPASQIGSPGVMSTLAAPAFHPPWPVDGMEATSNAVANNNPRASHLPFAVRPRSFHRSSWSQNSPRAQREGDPSRIAQAGGETKPPARVSTPSIDGDTTAIQTRRDVEPRAAQK